MNTSVEQEHQDADTLAMDKVTSTAVKPLNLMSPAFSSDERIPRKYSAEGDGISPPLEWETGPDQTMSYALIAEDPDAPQQEPFVHWMIYGIPAKSTATPEGIPDRPVLNVPQEALQGSNDRGNLGWFGPLPPEGHGIHHYHFQLFALDHVPDLHYGATRNQFISSIQGHVLAAGRLVGTYER